MSGPTSPERMAARDALDDAIKAYCVAISYDDTPDAIGVGGWVLAIHVPVMGDDPDPYDIYLWETPAGQAAHTSLGLHEGAAQRYRPATQ